MSKFTKIIIAIIILAFGGLVVLSVARSKEHAVSFENYDAAMVIEPNPDNGGIGDHVRGNLDSEVIFVEYADFQCSGCATVQTKITTLYEEYGDRVAFVFRHFPLNGHPNSRAAASAVESAGMQGFHSEMIDIMYSNQAAWYYVSGTERTDIFAKFFKQIAPEGDIERFKSDMGSSDISKKIDFDYGLGSKISKVTATPSLFVNGDYIDFTSAKDNADFFKILYSKLDAALKEKGLEVGPAKSEEN